MQKLWLSLLDALLGWQHELAQATAGAGPPGAGVLLDQRHDTAAAARLELQALLQELVRLVLARMGEQLPLDQVLAHVLHEHGADRLADMRDAIRDVLSSSRHQVRGNPRSNPTTDPNPNPYCSRPRATRSLSEST